MLFVLRVVMLTWCVVICGGDGIVIDGVNVGVNVDIGGDGGGVTVVVVCGGVAVVLSLVLVRSLLLLVVSMMVVMAALVWLSILVLFIT